MYCLDAQPDKEGGLIDKGKKLNVCNKNTIEQKYTADLIPSCRTIKAGELSRASNLNPRTFISYNKKENILYFTAIEGRSQDGDGVDLTMIPDYFLNNIDKNVDVILNLDGGNSSNIAFTPLDI